MLEKLKVLVVDDDIVYRKVLTTAVNGTGLAITAQKASNGVLALERLAQEHYDVVLLDVFMPEMGGLEALAVIRKRYPDIFVIMVSSEGAESAANTLRALKSGALDFVLKPTADQPEKNIVLLQNCLQALFLEIMVKLTELLPCQPALEISQAIRETASAFFPEKRTGKVFAGSVPDVIVIAASTGGPEALELILAGLPADVRIPVLVVQHMPATFTAVLALTLSQKCHLPVTEAQAGDGITGGKVLLAPGGKHMSVGTGIHGSKCIQLDTTALVHGVRPAADVLFQSIAKAYRGQKVLAIILTGMGCDGQQGVLSLKQACDCYCITQSERTSVVYGMPRCIVAANLSDEIVDLAHISRRIKQILLL